MTDQYKKILAEKGVSLERIGVREVALRRTDALAALQVLRESGVPILGGDVYLDHEGIVESTYANWYVDRQNSESRKDFAERSFLRANKYVIDFPKTTDGELLFVLVPLEGYENGVRFTS